jgi:hypothetical protein
VWTKKYFILYYSLIKILGSETTTNTSRSNQTSNSDKMMDDNSLLKESVAITSIEMIDDYSQDKPEGNVNKVAPVNAAATVSEREANPSLIHRVLHLNEWSEDFDPLYSSKRNRGSTWLKTATASSRNPTPTEFIELMKRRSNNRTSSQKQRVSELITMLQEPIIR